MMMPVECPGVPTEVLNPRNTWASKEEYDVKAKDLASQFIKNFEKYASGVNEEILAAAPKI
jgi:phosphoenolpyruvate carboxykinase (ATP)